LIAFSPSGLANRHEPAEYQRGRAKPSHHIESLLDIFVVEDDRACPAAYRKPEPLPAPVVDVVPYKSAPRQP